MPELAIPSFEWSNIRYNPSIVIRKDCLDIQSMIINFIRSSRKIEELAKSITRLNIKIKSEKDEKRKTKLAAAVSAAGADFTSLSSKFWVLYNDSGQRLRRVAVNNLALIHRLRKNLDDFIIFLENSPVSTQADENLKAGVINKFNEIKLLIKEKLKYLWIESKSNERELLNQTLLKEALSFERSYRKLKLIKRATIIADNFQGIVENMKQKPVLKRFPHFIGEWKKQVETLARMAERTKVVIHRQHMMANRLNKISPNHISKKKFIKYLETITANTRTLYTSINVKPYSAKSIAAQKPIKNIGYRNTEKIEKKAA